MKKGKKENKIWYKKIYKNIKSKSNISNAKDRFSSFLELPIEILKNTTKITMIENSDVLIEGYEKIIDYYDNYIKIKSSNIFIVIDGKKLDIKEINDFELVIQGEIYSINYQK